MSLKTKIRIVLITVLIFQAIAAILFYTIDENYFVQLFATSIVVSIIGISLRSKKP